MEPVKVELAACELALRRVERQAGAAQSLEELVKSLVVLVLCLAVDDDVVAEIDGALDAADQLTDDSLEYFRRRVDA